MEIFREPHELTSFGTLISIIAVGTDIPALLTLLGHPGANHLSSSEGPAMSVAPTLFGQALCIMLPK